MAPKKKNAFYFFMKEIQEKEARRGHRIPMNQMAAYAHPLWKQLSTAEMQPYEEMARDFKNDPNLRGGKLASDGTRVEDNRWEEQEKIRLENKMVQDVKTYCTSDCVPEEFIGVARKKLFYFMSFNMLCCIDDEVWIPIEVGIVEYSIEYGIHREYSKIMYPDRPPQGYAGTAKQKSEETHQISVFGEDCEERDLNVVFEQIKSFLNPVGNEEYPPLFCVRNKLDMTRGCIDWLCKRLKKENMFQVWDAVYLVMELAAGVGNPLQSYNFASDLLNKTSFDYHPSTRCPFHEEKDIHYCALAYSKKLGYLISDAICQLFDVPLTENHIPTRAVEDKAYTVTIMKESKPRSNLDSVRLDKASNYYQNAQSEQKGQSVKTQIPRQPASTCIALMNKLQLNAAPANVPGHGIGRGRIQRN